MKNLIFVVVIFIAFACSTTKDLKSLDSNSFTGKKNVLGLSAVNANNNYYTKAIIDYLTIKKILDGNSIRVYGLPKNNPKINDTTEVIQVALFPELDPRIQHLSNTNNDQIQKKLIESGIKTCYYDLPLKLKDLQSGFQFNHYVFKSSNRAAMQAFGLVNSELKENSLYVVTDYIQYQDANCSGLPTIRYAVGIRAEFRILGIESESDLKGIGSLANLAARVETNSQKVNITIKTIGLTGIDSRLSIPTNTTFDVKTYSDYEKLIDFIRNLKDDEDTTINANAINKKQLIVQPQIIPVMDDYRASLEYSFYPMLESIELLELKLKKIEENSSPNTKLTEIKNNINDLKISILEQESQDLASKYIKLKNDYQSVNNSLNIKDIFSYIYRVNELNSSEDIDTTKDLILKDNIREDKLVNKVGGQNVLIAKYWEEKGFEYILAKEYTKAISAFKNSEIEVPKYHSSYEIGKYLKANSEKVKTEQQFKEMLKFILEKYTWGVSDSIKNKLADAINK